jgi:hypothetical protein
MKKVRLEQLDILDIGNAIDLYGAIYSGKGRVFLIPLPTEQATDLETELEILEMSAEEMERFLNQTDVLDVKAGKAILRKSQRQIDQIISWQVYERDKYTCRYCGKTGIPLTIDHIDLWEDGGATVKQNLLSACRKCNKTRGNVPYQEWIASDAYIKMMPGLNHETKVANLEIIPKLQDLRLLRIKARSR